MQLSDGSFPWFRGMSSNRYITQYIATGIARLQRLGVEAATSETAKQILAKAVDYVDRLMKDDYEYIVKNKNNISQRHIRYTHVINTTIRRTMSDLPLTTNSRQLYDSLLTNATTSGHASTPT